MKTLQQQVIQHKKNNMKTLKQFINEDAFSHSGFGVAHYGGGILSKSDELINQLINSNPELLNIRFFRILGNYKSASIGHENNMPEGTDHFRFYFDKNYRLVGFADQNNYCAVGPNHKRRNLETDKDSVVYSLGYYISSTTLEKMAKLLKGTIQ